VTQQTKQKGIFFYFKLLVSVGLIFFLFQKVGWQNLWLTVKEAHYGFLTLYLLIGILGTLVSSMKWHLLAKSNHIIVSQTRLFFLYMVGYFFNQILPTSVGGDVVRGYELGKLSQKKSEAMASVFMERFTGLTVLILLALLVVVFTHAVSDVRLSIILYCAFIGYGIGVWMIYHKTFLRFLESKFTTPIFSKIIQKTQKLQDSIHYYRHHKKSLLLAVLYSFLFYGLAVIEVYVGCLTFGVSVALSDLCMIVPVLAILFIIPITIGGIGLQEWAYYFVLSEIGVPIAVGLSLGLLHRARSISFGLIGGCVYPLVGDTKFSEVKTLNSEFASKP